MKHKNSHIPTKEIARHQYEVEKLPLIDMAEMWGVIPDYVRRILRKMDIPPRPLKDMPSRMKPKTKFPSMLIDDVQHQVILGSILGDGHIADFNRTGDRPHFSNSFIRIIHSSKQLDYLKFKHQLLYPYACPIRIFSTRDGIRCGFQTYSHPYFTELRREWYPSDGWKVITLDLISSLTSFGLAIWFMDDGTRGVSKGCEFGFFCTEGFGIDSQPMLMAFLQDQFGIPCSVVSTGFGLKKIRVSKKGMGILRDIIRPYLIPSMLYKIGC